MADAISGRIPDPERRQAFLGGWAAAVNGRLYASVRKRKTHASMGNLFAWIYGDRPDAFRLATWERYVEHAEMTGDTADSVDPDP